MLSKDRREAVATEGTGREAVATEGTEILIAERLPTVGIEGSEWFEAVGIG